MLAGVFPSPCPEFKRCRFTTWSCYGLISPLAIMTYPFPERCYLLMSLLLQIWVSRCSASIHGPAKYHFPRTQSVQSQLEGRRHTVGLLSTHVHTGISHLPQGSGTTDRGDLVELDSPIFTFQEKWCHCCSKACFPKSYWVVKMDLWRSSGEAMWLSLAQMRFWIFNDCSQFKDPTYWCLNFLSDWKKNSRVQIWPTKLQQLCGVYLCSTLKFPLVNAEWVCSSAVALSFLSTASLYLLEWQ